MTASEAATLLAAIEDLEAKLVGLHATLVTLNSAEGVTA